MVTLELRSIQRLGLLHFNDSSVEYSAAQVLTFKRLKCIVFNTSGVENIAAKALPFKQLKRSGTVTNTTPQAVQALTLQHLS